MYGRYATSDTQNDTPRVRVIDATGQTFQLSYPTINWSGWGYITLQVVGGSSWGGANDGQFHLPLKFDTLFLFDTDQLAQKGVVYFTPPVLVSFE